MIHDKEVLNALRVSQIIKYLKDNNWGNKGKNDLGVTYWVYEDDKKNRYSAFLPPNNQFVDFTERVREVLMSLSEIENRSQLAIVNDILSN